MVGFSTRTQQLLLYENDTDETRFQLPLSLLTSPGVLELHCDLMDCGIDVCSPEVLWICDLMDCGIDVCSPEVLWICDLLDCGMENMQNAINKFSGKTPILCVILRGFQNIHIHMYTNVYMTDVSQYIGIL